MDEIKLIFLTDMHLVSENSFLGINTFDSFSSVVDDVIQNHSNADFVIFGGDLVQDQSKDSYAFFNLLYLFAVTKPTIEIANKKMDANKASNITTTLASLLM